MSVQERLMRAAHHAASAFDAHGAKAKSKTNGAVNTAAAGSTAPDDPTDNSAARDLLNAIV